MVQEHPIRVVARRTGLNPHVIRIWEKRYGAVVPRRTPTKRRFYTDEDIERLILLKRATLSGRSIGQIARLSQEELLELMKTDGTGPPVSTVQESGNDQDQVKRAVAACLEAVQTLDRVTADLASLRKNLELLLSHWKR